MSNEVWGLIPDYPGYEVSNLGHVRSYYKKVFGGWVIDDEPQRVLSGGVHTAGYPFVRIKNSDGEYCVKYVHRLVLLAFVGPCPAGMQTCHYDGDPTNNRLDNLRYDTALANFADMRRHGRKPGSGRLFDDFTAYLIRVLYASGVSSIRLSELFGCSSYTICRIANGKAKAYSQVDGPVTRRRHIGPHNAGRIRRLYASGRYTYRKLGKMFGITDSGV